MTEKYYLLGLLRLLHLLRNNFGNVAHITNCCDFMKIRSVKCQVKERNLEYGEAFCIVTACSLLFS